MKRIQKYIMTFILTMVLCLEISPQRQVYATESDQQEQTQEQPQGVVGELKLSKTEIVLNEDDLVEDDPIYGPLYQEEINFTLTVQGGGLWPTYHHGYIKSEYYQLIHLGYDTPKSTETTTVYTGFVFIDQHTATDTTYNLEVYLIKENGDYEKVQMPEATLTVKRDFASEKKQESNENPTNQQKEPIVEKQEEVPVEEQTTTDTEEVHKDEQLQTEPEKESDEEVVEKEPAPSVKKEAPKKRVYPYIFIFGGTGFFVAAVVFVIKKGWIRLK